MRKSRLTFAVFSMIGAAGLLGVLILPEHCPIEIQLLRTEPAEVGDIAGEQLSLGDFRVHNCESVPLAFDRDAKIEARIANQWVDVPNVWTLGGLAATGSPSSTNDILLFIPERAEECRVRLKYRRTSKHWYSLGIHDPWARYHAPSRLSLRAQQITAKISSRLYDWLWPINPTPKPVKWKRLTCEVTIPQSHAAPD